MPSPPVGTIAFLFANLENVDRLWEERPEEMPRILGCHASLLRDAIHASHGYLFKTSGDLHCVVFEHVSDALAAALDALKECSGLSDPPSLRIGIHVGYAELRDGDYFGPPVNLVSRLLEAAQGGMVLISEAARLLLNDPLPSGWHLVDCGSHRLRHIESPHRIFLVSREAVNAAGISLHTLGEVRHLPSLMPDAFIGREREMADLARLLASSGTALITLTGPGGCGKTRLALHAADSMLHHFPDGVWWVDLSSIRQAGGVMAAILSAMEIPERSEVSPVERLVGHLRGRTLLLVLDNFERVLDAAGDLAIVLRRCPQLRVLVTSRERLNLSIEREFNVPPLPLSESMRLFDVRSEQALPGISTRPERRRDVEVICSRLDGIPLAVELTAARVRGMTLSQIVQRLDHRFELLKGMRRDVPDRQRTMRQTVDWSYDLLTENERTLYTELAIFVGPFTLEAAEAVCGGNAVSVLDGILSLCDQSLLRRIEGKGDDRYSMLQTLRDYGMEKLAASGRLEEMQRRHASYYLEYLERVDWTRGTPLEAIRAELPNLRAGMDAAINLEDDPLIASYGVAWRWFFLIQAQFREGRERLACSEAALRRMGDTERLGRLLVDEGLLTFYYSADKARLMGEEAVALTGTPALLPVRVRALNLIGLAMIEEGRIEEGIQRMEEGLRLAREQDRAGSIASVSGNLGWAYGLQENRERAIPYFQEAIRLDREQDELRDLSLNLVRLGRVLVQEDSEEAARCLEEGLARARDIGDEWTEAVALFGYGELAFRLGHLKEAERWYRRSVGHFDRLGLKAQCADLLVELMSLAMASGDYIRAAHLLSCIRAADRLYSIPFTTRGLEKDAEAIRARIRPGEWERFTVQAEFMTEEEYQSALTSLQDREGSEDGGVG